ncbi:hypothetical protein AVEN_172163-1 [Araneus ventricosus]|uniref:Uncharacterized protein n=1 Tax=Araneus ventricosus TaxID=182803 RepID=A0A4Y2TRH6_ARAVE|nr:hypothetical protein AVEN_172163-1 [Araneus ventricosus]
METHSSNSSILNSLFIVDVIIKNTFAFPFLYSRSILRSIFHYRQPSSTLIPFYSNGRIHDVQYPAKYDTIRTTPASSLSPCQQGRGCTILEKRGSSAYRGPPYLTRE